MQLAASVKSHVVGMRVQQRHAPVLSDPIQLFLPDAIGLFPQQEKQGRILRQGIGKLDVSAARIVES